MDSFEDSEVTKGFIVALQELIDEWEPQLIQRASEPMDLDEPMDEVEERAGHLRTGAVCSWVALIEIRGMDPDSSSFVSRYTRLGQSPIHTIGLVANEANELMR